VLAGTDAYSAELRRRPPLGTVLAQVPPDSEDARNLAAGLEKVRELMGDTKAASPRAKAAPRPLPAPPR
jgi:hypothetical protein